MKGYAIITHKHSCYSTYQSSDMETHLISTPRLSSIDTDITPIQSPSSSSNKGYKLVSDEDTPESSSNVDISRKADTFSCIINLLSTIVGAGMLGTPYGFGNTGWILGFILLTLCGISSALALYFLTKCASITKLQPGPVTFHSIAELAIPGYAWLIDLTIGIKCFGVGVSYLIIVGDLMPIVMHTWQVQPISFFQSRYVWICFGFCLIAPIAYFENMDSLKYTSALSMAFVLVLAMVVVLYSIPGSGYDPCYDQEDKVCYGDTHVLVSSGWDVLKVLPLFAFAYTCQQVYYIIYHAL